MMWQSERYIFTLNMHFSAQEAAIVEEDLSPFAQKKKTQKKQKTTDEKLTERDCWN